MIDKACKGRIRNSCEDLSQRGRRFQDAPKKSILRGYVYSFLAPRLTAPICSPSWPTADVEQDLEMALSLIVSSLGLSFDIHRCPREAITGSLHRSSILTRFPSAVSRPRLVKKARASSRKYWLPRSSRRSTPTRAAVKIDLTPPKVLRLPHKIFHLRTPPASHAAEVPYRGSCSLARQQPANERILTGSPG